MAIRYSMTAKKITKRLNHVPTMHQTEEEKRSVPFRCSYANSWLIHSYDYNTCLWLVPPNSFSIKTIKTQPLIKKYLFHSFYCL